MPPAHEDHRATDLTLGQAEQLGRLLTPAIAQALRPEFAKLREDVTTIMLQQKVETDQRFAAVQATMQSHGSRISALETVRWKLWGIWVGGSAVAMFVINHFWPVGKK